ncbi:hypothetical protein ACWIGW_44125 [Nocardia brasiliensis]|uniref:hypothetical protein n=1 Tax=Streptomyces sp. NPDC056056 TaxID=3345698 RepID=UPI0035DCE0CE
MDPSTGTSEPVPLETAPKPPSPWPAVVLTLGLAAMCFLFDGVLIALGLVEPRLATTITIVIVVAITGSAVLDTRNAPQKRRLRALRATAARMLHPGDSQ